MLTQIETAREIAMRDDKPMQLAYQIIKDSWLSEGMTEDEWYRGEISGEVWDRLVGQGLSWEEADAYLEKASWEEIERKHQEMYPGRYELS